MREEIQNILIGEFNMQHIKSQTFADVNIKDQISRKKSIDNL